MASDVYSPSPEDPPERLPDTYPGWLGIAVSAAYVAMSMMWIVFVTIGAVVVFMAGSAVSGDIEGLLAGEALPAWLIAGLTLAQFGGWLLIAAGLAFATRRPMREAFALRSATIGAFAAATLGGLTVGIFPGKVAELLQQVFPSIDLGNLGAINEALSEGPLFGRVLMAVAVVIGAPLVEELVFRGFLWDALSKSVPVWVVWILTSVLFAIYHIDPPHVMAVVLIGLFLGWLRMASRSIWPSIVAHAVNNGLATAMAMAYGAQDVAEAQMPWWGAFLALAITLGFGSLALLGRPDTEKVSSPASPSAP